MPALGKFERFLNYKFILPIAAIALASSVATAGQAETALPSVPADEADKPTLEALHDHAETIAAILETASERVERLAGADAGSPDLLAAIRQELALSRRWNRHLTTILGDVAEARRALGEREREAAREIARMTAAAEEARLELIALKEVLKSKPDEPAEGRAGWSDSRSDGAGRSHLGEQMAADSRIADLVTRRMNGIPGDLDEARSALASMEDAQASAFRNVDTVRVKIIEALQTLAASQGGRPLDLLPAGGDLSSEDVTAWAASIATQIGRTPERRGD